MKFFFALLISLAYAAEHSNSGSDSESESNPNQNRSIVIPDRSIERAPSFRFDLLPSDVFYCIIIFLSAEQTLDLRFVSRGFYDSVIKIWPRMELTTVIDNIPQPLAGFSHIIKMSRIKRVKDQPFFSGQVQLKYLRSFKLTKSSIYDLQLMINLLPKKSLTSLKLHINGPICPLISNIDFPKLTHLKLHSDVRLSHGILNSLPNCMKVLKVTSIHMDDAISSSLATGLKAMDKLEVLSLKCCIISKNGLSAILENLPTSLKSLNISNNRITESGNTLPNFGFERLKEMKSLQKISFYEGEDEFVHEIALNLPECITEINCFMDAKVLLAFRKRGKLINVRRINFYLISRDLYSDYLKIFPNLDEDINKRPKTMIYK